MTKRNHSFGFLLLGIFGVLIFIKLLNGSLFLNSPDRIQFVVYGQDTKLYSLSHRDDINYYVGYNSDLKIKVPGGYGAYRIGALSKLIEYEKKPELLSRAFSVATSSYVTYYFYPSKNEIYYSNNNVDTYKAPTLKELFLYKSNARLLDRLYLYLQVLQTSSGSFQNLDIGLLTKKIQESNYLSSDAFGKEYKGFFYNRTYRTERLSVQIKYTKDYDTAVAIGKILEGNGIRVVDVSKTESKSEQCLITSSKLSSLDTIRDTISIFNCKLKSSKAETSDIIFTLGSVEREWEL